MDSGGPKELCVEWESRSRWEGALFRGVTSGFPHRLSTTVPIGRPQTQSSVTLNFPNELEYGPMPNVMVALPNIGGALCSTPQSLADAHYLIAVQ